MPLQGLGKNYSIAIKMLIPILAGIGVVSASTKERRDCQRRCKSWFSGMPDVERSCINACKTNAKLTKDEFLCSGNYIEEALLVARYGYDPCPGQGVDVETFLDPLGDRPREDAKNKQLSEVAIILAVVAVAALIILFIALRK